MPFILLSGVVIGAIVRWVLAALAVGVVVFVGLSTLLDQVTGYVQTTFGTLPNTALQVAGLLKVDTAINIILSAYGINVAMMATKVLRGK